jgi:hypothetical protein
MIGRPSSQSSSRRLAGTPQLLTFGPFGQLSDGYEGQPDLPTQDCVSDPARGPALLLDGRRHVGVDNNARHEVSGESRFSGSPEVGEEGVEFLVGFPHVEGELVERSKRLRSEGARDGVEVSILSGLNLRRGPGCRGSGDRLP